MQISYVFLIIFQILKGILPPERKQTFFFSLLVRIIPVILAP